MNITFFIGNGFDISLGLKTKYFDFYPYFLEHASKDNMIKNWMVDDKELWSDLEDELGRKIEEIQTEGQKEKFYEDKTELEILLLDYLENEQDKFLENDLETYIEVFLNSLANPFYGLSKVENGYLEDTFAAYSKEGLVYQLISFNYTSCLNQVMKLAREKSLTVELGRRRCALGDVFHIHGTLGAEMILGVNDESQVKSSFLVEDEEFLDTFIKARANESIGQGKINYVNQIIKKSHIIGIFGMSLGETDKMWWKKLVLWLGENSYNRLIIYIKGNDKIRSQLRRKLPTNIIRLKNQYKSKFLEKGSASEIKKEDLKKQIFIIFDSDIFDFLKENSESV